MRARLAAVVAAGALVSAGMASPVSAAPLYRRLSGSTFRPTQTVTSGNGRFVAFVARPGSFGPSADNPTGAPNAADAPQVYVADRKTGQVELVSVSIRNTPGNFESAEPSISADGRYVVFASRADNLVPGDTNTVGIDGWDVFLRDRKLRRTTRVSVDVRGQELQVPIGRSRHPAISPDGSTIAFYSGSNVLASPSYDASQASFDVYLFAIPRGAKPSQVRLVGRKADGTPLAVDYAYPIGPPALSASGRYLASVTDSDGGTPYVRDLKIGRTTVLDPSRFPPYLSDAGANKQPATRMAIDGAGTKVLFELQSEVPFTSVSRRSLMVWQLRTGVVQQVDGAGTVVSDPTGLGGDKQELVLVYAGEPAFSGNGRYVVFTRADPRTVKPSATFDLYAYDYSYGFASHLFDTNEPYKPSKVVKRDLQTGATTDVVTCDPTKPQTCLGTYAPGISYDGSVVSFVAAGALDATDSDWTTSADQNRVRFPADVYVRTG